MHCRGGTPPIYWVLEGGPQYIGYPKTNIGKPKTKTHHCSSTSGALSDM